MKRPLLCFAFLLFGLALQAQEAPTDSAAMIVDQYLRLLNFDAVKTDSMLYIESFVIDRDNTDDTLFMRRWHIEPNSNRVELWHGGELGFGLTTDGYKIFKKYNAEKKQWQRIPVETYYDNESGYNYHGPLHNWRKLGVELTYMGELDFQGNRVYRVLAKEPYRYDRYYLFEKMSSILFLIDEQTTHSEDITDKAIHVDWRAFHEYVPLGDCLFPSVESYQHEERITIIYHKYRYLPIDRSLFK